MTTFTKSAIAFGVVGGVVALVTFFGYSPFIKVVQSFSASPAGSTFNTAKVAQVNINPQSITSTSTSVLRNTDSSARYILDGFVNCTGLTTMFGGTAGGVSSFDWSIATSATTGVQPSVLYSKFAAVNISLGTSTAYNYIATSTYTAPWGRVWNPNEYLVVQTNATSSTATCTAGVHYIGS